MLAAKKDKYFLDKLIEFINIPSISTSESYVQEIGKARDWLIDLLAETGFVAELWGEDKSIIWATQQNQSSDLPMIVFYGHYDVQPAAQEGWDTDPFKGTIKNERIYGRGSTDNKGQLIACIAAVKDLVSKNTTQKFQFAFLIEGGEEISSTVLKKYIEQNIDSLSKAKYLFVTDSSLAAQNTPVLIESFRGNLAFEIKLTANLFDVHAGIYGGVLPSAASRLVEVINKLDLESLQSDSSPEETISDQLNDKLGFIDEISQINIQGYSPSEPTKLSGRTASLVMTSFHSGSHESGISNSIPASASAKYNLRFPTGFDSKKLVKELSNKVQKYEIGEDYKVELIVHRVSEPLAIRFSKQTASKLNQTAKLIYEKELLARAEGGSLSIVPYLQRLAEEVIMFGLANNDANMHGPNENLTLENFYLGVEFIKEIASELSI